MNNFIIKIGQSAILIGFGGVIFAFFLQNKLPLLVYPTYIPLIVFTGVFFIILGIYNLFPQKKHHHDHSHDMALFSQGLSILFLSVPILFGVFIQPQPLSSQTALQRGVSVDIPGIYDAPQSLVFNAQSRDRKLIDWVKLFSYDPEPDNYKDQEIQVEGFILLDPELPENTFMISQFIISCCAADARPIGIAVKYDPEQISPKNDQWISLEGIIKEGIIKNNRQAVIQLTTYENIDIPESPYEFL